MWSLIETIGSYKVRIWAWFEVDLNLSPPNQLWLWVWFELIWTRCAIGPWNSHFTRIAVRAVLASDVFALPCLDDSYRVGDLRGPSLSCQGQSKGQEKNSKNHQSTSWKGEHVGIGGTVEKEAACCYQVCFSCIFYVLQLNLSLPRWAKPEFHFLTDLLITSIEETSRYRQAFGFAKDVATTSVKTGGDTLADLYTKLAREVLVMPTGSNFTEANLPNLQKVISNHIGMWVSSVFSLFSDEVLTKYFQPEEVILWALWHPWLNWPRTDRERSGRGYYCRIWTRE